MNTEHTIINVDGNSESFVFYAKKGVTYSFGSNIEGDRSVVGYSNTIPNYTGAPLYGNSNVNDKKFTAKYDAYATIYYNSSRNDEIAKTFRVNEGETLLPFEPYHRQSHITTVPNGLLGIEVTDASLANYVDSVGRMWRCDEVDYERGVRIGRVSRIVLNGAEEWVSASGSFGYFARYIPKSPILLNYNNVVKVMCTHFKSVSYNADWNGLNSFVTNHATQGIIFKSPLVTDTSLDLWKSWLKEQYVNGTPVTIDYLLETPIETPLPAEEIAAYRALHSNYPTTNISNDCDAGMEVSMNADLKIYIDNKIAELSTAILNN